MSERSSLFGVRTKVSNTLLHWHYNVIIRVSAICCHVMNYPRTQQLETGIKWNLLLPHSSWQLGIWAWLRWVGPSGSNKAGMKTLTNWEGSTSTLTQVVGSTKFLVVVALSALGMSGYQAEATVVSKKPSSAAHQRDLPTWPPLSSRSAADSL